MTLQPYRKLLTMAKEAIDQTLVPVRERAARKRAELEVAKLDEQIATLERDITTIASEKDIDFEKIIRKMDEVALLDRKRKQFTKIIEEMFPA